MIAPAMKTRQDEPLPFRELARRRAEISRQLAQSSLPRWSTVAQNDAQQDWAVQVDLRFSMGDEGLAWVHGEYSARAGLRCQRCLEVLETGFSGTVALCLVEDGPRATELAAVCDVLVVSGDEVAIADIIEDELLLGVPQQLCEQEPCDRKPGLSYPAPDAPAEEPEGPFAVLGKLKND